MKNNLVWDEVGVGKKKQVALLVVQVTEHGGLSCPDSTLRYVVRSVLQTTQLLTQIREM